MKNEPLVRSDNLPFLFQEIFTAVVRLREQRQSVTDGRLFRAQIREALNLANKEATQGGYSTDAIRLATFAVVAFVDESVLNQGLSTFEEWIQRPLQQELFGVHVAGEIFFENVRRLLAQADSPELADLLETYHLCLLLGYRGRYGAGSPGELSAINQAIGGKIRRIRGGSGDLSPAWAIPNGEKVPRQADPWVRRLLFVFVGCLAVAALLFATFKIGLRSDLSAIESQSAQTQRSLSR